jgi:oligopeptide/dipeptide ABC transporter ATP-binding protein
MNPEAILADEAISAVDVSLRIEIVDFIPELQTEFETTFPFISHDLSNARCFAEHGSGRIAVMYLGEIVDIASAERLIHDPRHPYTEVLRWATPNLDLDETDDSGPPLREVDVPDPVDPPSGCRFHTQCPVAREACREEKPSLRDGDDGDGKAACFREDPDHRYWSSEPLDGAEAEPDVIGSCSRRNRPLDELLPSNPVSSLSVAEGCPSPGPTGAVPVDNRIITRTPQRRAMTRYVPNCDDGRLTLVSEAGDDRVEIGSVDEVIAAIGDATHSIEYNQKQRTQPWLDTDDGTPEIDVREAVTTLPHTAEMVDELREYDMSTDRYGLPLRTVEFANELLDILDAQGKDEPA